MEYLMCVYVTLHSENISCYSQNWGLTSDFMSDSS